MASELRQIVFEAAEVASAMSIYHRKMKKPLVNGVVNSVALTEKGAVSARIEIADVDGNKAHYVLASNELMAALILFCRENRIPLPSKANKRLTVFDGKLSAILTLNTTTLSICTMRAA